MIDVIRAGARGYITKTISGPELLQAVYRVAAGDAVFSPRLAGFVLDAFAQSARRRRDSTPSSTSCRPVSASPAPDRPRVHLQGGGSALGISAKTVSRTSRRSSATPAVDSPRVDQMGHRPPLGLDRGDARGPRRRASRRGQAGRHRRSGPAGAAGRSSVPACTRRRGRPHGPPAARGRDQPALPRRRRAVRGGPRARGRDGPPLDHRSAGRHREFRQTGRSDWAVHVAWPWAASPWLVPWPCRHSTSCWHRHPPVLPPLRAGEAPGSSSRGAVRPTWPTR